MLERMSCVSLSELLEIAMDSNVCVDQLLQSSLLLKAANFCS